MKKFLYACSLVLSLCSVLPTFGWTLYVTNWVNKAVNIHTSWAGAGWAFGKCFSCCDDHATLQPGQRIAINAGACLLTELRVDGGTPYTSSGQRTYNELFILGPAHGQLRAGRTDATGRISANRDLDRDGKLTIVNATSFPATNIVITVERLHATEKGTHVEKIPMIPAGGSFVFDADKVLELSKNNYMKHYNIGSIKATINGKDIAITPDWKREVVRNFEFFISGPPDGSDPQFVELVQ